MKSITIHRDASGQYSTSESTNSDVAGTYVQKTDYDELRRDNYDQKAKIKQLMLENVELRIMTGVAESFPLKVRIECRKLIKSGSFTRDFISMLHDSADRAMNESASQHLADIKVDAVVKFAEFVRYNYEGAMNADSLEDFADEYANKLRANK